MLFEYSVHPHSPLRLRRMKQHSKLRKNMATTSMTRWSCQRHSKLDVRLSTPKTSMMAKQLMGYSPFAILFLDHQVSPLFESKDLLVEGLSLLTVDHEFRRLRTVQTI